MAGGLVLIATTTTHQENPKMWTKPEFSELRFGFEITMYIANR